jgi:beta-mannosidase
MPQDSLENFVLGSQLAQATGVRHTLERARTRYPECTGALYYKMNDNYPAASWASVDWYGAPKLSHYVFQDAFAPLHACLVFSTLNPAGEPVEQPVFLLDDAGALQNKEWEVRVRAFGPDLQVVKQQKFAGSGGIDKVKRLGTFSLDAGQTKTTPLLTVVEVWTDEEKASRTFYWSNYEAAPGCLTDLPGAAVSMSVDEDAVVLVNEGPTPAVGVHVERPGHAHTFTADDNFLWLDPGESARIAVSHTKGLSLGGWNLN